MCTRPHPAEADYADADLPSHCLYPRVLQSIVRLRNGLQISPPLSSRSAAARGADDELERHADLRRLALDGAPQAFEEQAGGKLPEVPVVTRQGRERGIKQVAVGRIVKAHNRASAGHPLPH